MSNGDKKSGSYFQPFREITIPFETRSKTSSSEIITSIIGQINNEFRKIYNRLFSRRVDADLIKASNGLKPMKFEGAAEYVFDAPMDIENPLTIKASNNFPSVNLAGADGKTLGMLRADSYNRVYFLEYSKNSNYYNRFYLPFPDDELTENITYFILTSKEPVTVEQGGTEATTPLDAATNLLVPSLANVAEKRDLDANTDMNTLKTPGTYRCPSAAVCATLKNAPPVTSSGFRLFVSNLTTANSFIQTAIYNNATPTIYVHICNSSDTWGDWKKLTFS